MTLPLNGRYHDGHVRCRDDGSCYGFLLVVYSMSASQCAYFEEYQLNNDPPVTVFTSETSTGDWLLRHTHERLMSHHANRGIAQLPAAVRETIPTMGVLSQDGTAGDVVEWNIHRQELFRDWRINRGLTRHFMLRMRLSVSTAE